MTARDPDRLNALIGDVLEQLAQARASCERQRQDLAALAEDIERGQADPRRRFGDWLSRLARLPFLPRSPPRP